MSTELEKALESLSPIQKKAVAWQDGAALVLAGPGAGKTRVLTTRIARLLADSKDKKFRILALTYTTKAATEMRERVDILVPGLAESRTFIGTFHAFCTQILRQHGSHINIQPDFAIFGQKEDQEALLTDALSEAIREGKNFSMTDISVLSTIKDLKSKVISPEKALQRVKDPHIKDIYELYEETLRKENVIDFEGLILETCRLLASMPAIAARIRQSYPYWMIDEFQDTTTSQYWLLHYLSGGEFKNIFIVADDDQIIYYWAGASYRQIEKFRKDYNPEFIQLVENHRCPPEIVDLANRLVANNTQRAPEKKETTASRLSPINAVSLEVFETDNDEREAVAERISALGKESWGKVVVLARTWNLLNPLLEALKSRGVNAVITKRRDDFISPQFVWLQACLDQVLLPTNKRHFKLLVDSANRICELELDSKLLIAEAESTGEIFCERWAKTVALSDSVIAKELGLHVQKLIQSRDSWKQVVQKIIPILLKTAVVGDGAISDADEDYTAWNLNIKDIRSEIGHEPDLSDLVQGMALRSKEPPKEPDTVALMTIHISKGLEFDTVYIIGLAEGEMPSWQSREKGNTSPEMEEERRNCFVAITRTKEKLNLSAAKIYRNWKKEPSRFLKEMQLLS